MGFPFALLPPPAAVASIGISGSPSGSLTLILRPAFDDLILRVAAAAAIATSLQVRLLAAE